MIKLIFSTEKSIYLRMYSDIDMNMNNEQIMKRLDQLLLQIFEQGWDIDDPVDEQEFIRLKGACKKEVLESLISQSVENNEEFDEVGYYPVTICFEGEYMMYYYEDGEEGECKMVKKHYNDLSGNLKMVVLLMKMYDYRADL